MKAIIYARYSSHNQTEQSIEGQIRVCTEYAARNGITLHGTYVDRATTGTNDNRPDFQRMLKDSSKGLFEVVLVYKFDRFARNRYDSAQNKRILKNNGVKLVSATENIPDSPEGIMLESLLEGMAEYYSAELSQKVKRGKMECALETKHHGGVVPFGYKLDENRHFVPDEKDAPVVVDIFKRYSQGESINNIVADLNLLQIKNNRGNPFPYEGIRRIFRNTAYIGTYKNGDYVKENAFEPIIDKETWERVQEIMKKNSRNPAKNKAREPYLLSGKVVCGHCGKNIIGNASTTRNGYYPYYICQGKKKKLGCEKNNIKKDVLETLVFDIVVKELSQPERQKELAQKVIDYQNQQNEEKELVKGYRLQLAETKKKKENLMKAVEFGTTSTTIFARIEELEQSEISIGDEILRNMHHVPVPTEQEVLGYFEKIFSEKSDGLKEGILRDTVCYVKLFDDKVVIGIGFVDNEGDCVEICCSDLMRELCSCVNKSEQTEIIVSTGFIWILAKISPYLPLGK